MSKQTAKQIKRLVAHSLLALATALSLSVALGAMPPLAMLVALPCLTNGAWLLIA